jgi:hypothetical protein
MWKNIKGSENMSNHSGSYMLNEVLKSLEQHKVFEILKKDDIQKLIVDILSIASAYDCNDSEILLDIGKRLKICSFCLEYGTDFQSGVCGKCNERFYSD